MIPLSNILLYFHQHYNNDQYVARNVLREFSEMDLDMLVDMGILSCRRDSYFGTKNYRLRRPRRASKGTKMVYSQRRQYAIDYQKNRRAA